MAMLIVGTLLVTAFVFVGTCLLDAPGHSPTEGENSIPPPGSSGGGRG
jgi:hypothetical protein